VKVIYEMVEGPSAKAYAFKIESEFRGERVTKLLAKSRKHQVPIGLVLGRRVDGAESFGKNIVVRLEDLGLRLHLMMYGRLYVQPLDAPLLKPESRLRLLLETSTKRLTVFNAPVVELSYYDELRSRLLRTLGPDPLRPEWAPLEAARRLLSREGKVGVVLLDQGVMAGVGNIIRNEVLFRAGIHPERLVSALSLKEALDLAHEVEALSWEFYKRKLRGIRVGELFKVYNKAGRPCPNCGVKIKMYVQQPIGRKTFVCEACQR